MTDDTRDTQNAEYLLGYLLEAIESTLNNMGSHPRLAALRAQVEFVKGTREAYNMMQRALTAVELAQAEDILEEGDRS